MNGFSDIVRQVQAPKPVVVKKKRTGGNGNLKLTDGQVEAIRAQRGKKTQKELAKEFKCCPQTICAIQTGQTRV